jgi:hypothetical protein
MQITKTPVRRRVRATASATSASLVLLGLGVLAAGCGGSPSSNGVAQLTTTNSTTSNSSSSGASAKGGNPTAFSSCMRKNGVPNFPDPDSRGGLTINGGSGLNPSSPQFKQAQSACSKYLPNGGKVDPAAQAKALRWALKFSACMRSHGVPNFPDPKVSGGAIGLTMSRSSGINPRSPQFQAAQRACQKDMPGPKGGFSTQRSGKS